jgi:hypothetical protein
LSFQPDNISLREINDQDIDTLMELTGNPDVIKYLPGIIQDRQYAENGLRDSHQMIMNI